jgi:hypothetical protein
MSQQLQDLKNFSLMAGATVGGPGSLLNSQGHPAVRLTSARDVTNPGRRRWIKALPVG